MGKTYQAIDYIDDMPTFEKPVMDIVAEVPRGGALKVLTVLEYHTEQQRKWWKGVLLKALSKDNGETVRQWETKLIMAIFPEDVKYIAINNQVFPVAESITNYGKKKMNRLIEESVAQCHEWGFNWVTLPDSDLRKE